MPEGTVVRLYSDWADVVVDGAGRETVSVRLRGRLAKERSSREKSALAVGDRIVLEGEANELILAGRLERRTKLSRRHPHGRHQEQVIAANVDHVLVVASADKPEFRSRLVDRHLVAASAEGLDASLCITKCDLAPADRPDALAAPYRDVPIPVFLVGLGRAESMERLLAELESRVTVLVGPSGVGKSTLRNALLPEALGQARTGAVSRKWGKGRHVTTAATFEPLAEGGYLVDTPGIREFGLWRLEPDDVAAHFPEFRDVACAFRNCRHGAEPGCGLVAKVERGEAGRERLDSLRAIADSLREEG